MGTKLFQKATSVQAYFKAALYAKQGRGKTLTSLLWAEGLAMRENKRIAYIDTELGTDFYTKDITERKVHPKAFDFDRLVTRSIMEAVEAVESIDPNEHGVVVIDSITHLWEAAQAAYTGPRMSNGGIPIQAWQGIKKPYKKLMSLFLDGNFHAILCGREGVQMEKDEDGEAQVVGAKMKAEGETPYEPHILGRMQHRGEEGGPNNIVSVFFEKDRSGILAGRTIDWPNYDTIAPVVAYLTGTKQGTLGTAEQAAEKDATAQATANEKATKEREALFKQIRDALQSAKGLEDLKTAWSLTTGKKTKLGDMFAQLETVKEGRKAEMMQEVGA